MILKFVITSILLLCLVTSAQAQQGFNKIYNFYPGVDEFNQMYVDGDVIFCIGIAYDTADWPSPLKIMMVKMDTFGNVLASKLYKDPLNDFLSMDFLWGDVIKTSQGFYAFHATALNRGGNLLIQIDTALDIKSVFEHHAPINDDTPFCNALLELQDGGFFVAGSIYRPSLKADGFVRRLDKDGNLLWLKYYGNYYFNEGFSSIVKVDDNRFVLAGADQARGSLWVIDSNGVLLQQKIVTEQALTAINSGMIRSSTDAGFIAQGHTYLGQGQWGGMVQSSIMKFDDALNLEWLKFVGPSFSQFNIFTDLAATPDGNYVAAGERTWYDMAQPSDDWGGWLFKFSEQGDSLWARADNAPPPLAPSGEFVYGGVGVLPSGSIIGVGKGEIGNQSVGFVVKVSADGCLDTVLCQTSSTRLPLFSQFESVQVFPNPATVQVTFQCSPALSGQKLLVLRNAIGQLVQQHSFAGSSFECPLQGLPAGMYFWEVSGAKGKRAAGRLVLR